MLVNLALAEGVFHDVHVPIDLAFGTSQVHIVDMLGCTQIGADLELGIERGALQS